MRLPADEPLAGGEYVCGTAPFRPMLEERSVDPVIIDLMGAGGITPPVLCQFQVNFL